MRIISKNNLCINRPYINLKKIPLKISLTVGNLTESGFKSTYIINQHTEKLCSIDPCDTEHNKIILNRELLHEKLLIEVNYSSKNNKSTKFKVYLILDNIKYALPFSSFEDIYNDCMNILTTELNEKEELTYIKESFNSLENDEIPVDITLNLERFNEFIDKANYKRNVYYFVINNIASYTSKYDVNSNINEILVNETLKVLRYDYNARLYEIVEPINKLTKIKLQETDIICDLSEPNFPTVSIYTEYGLGKLLDIKNNVIPNTRTISLFANILDLGLEL